MVHAESGLALECRTEQCGSHTLLLATMAAFIQQSRRMAPQPRAYSADGVSCSRLEQRPPFCFCSVSSCERSRQGRGAEVKTSFTPSHVGYIVRHQTPPGRQGASRQQPRLQSGLPGLLRASSHNRKQCPRPLSFAQNIRTGSWLGPSQPWPEQE